MATKEQVIAALKRHLDDVDDGLFTIPGTGRIMGFVASSVFANLDHEQRQQRLWAAIDEAIPAGQTANIGPITAMTPDEARLHHVAEAD